MKNRTKIGIIVFAILLLCVFIGFTADKAGEEINWQVISSGGCQGSTSANYQISSTIGQTAIGSGNSTDYGLTHGYWQTYDSGGICDCEPGNANADATINIFDVTYIISFLYMSGPSPSPYALCNGDPNNDCTCNIFDVTYIISFLYMDGPPPCTCEEWLSACGPPLM